MKLKYSLIIILLIATIASCSNGQSSISKLDAKAFSEKIKSTENPIIIDVRTPGEFASGHLANAVNMNWNDASVEEQLKKLDPSKSYFLYCLSGGRSSSAAEFMRANGFKNVTELTGGIMKWRAAGLPESTDKSASVESTGNKGLSMEQYQALLKNDKVVVIDIFAEWCGPCKKMAPYLTEMQNTMGDKVEIIRIDADKNVELCKLLNVDALPTIYVYKNNTKTFEHIGFLSKEELIKQL
jgi:thioredoxin 1